MDRGIIRELHGKLMNRDGIRGIVFSLSGFSKGVVTQVQDYANSRAILLFGKEDIEKLMCHGGSFDETLSRKYDELIMRRKAVYE
ncbi:MAG TPA: hypothetical protein VJ302_24090 [Blastocatellia bacterium]|nr:hypothetical protein [Blastocatellia bacterium]